MSSTPTIQMNLGINARVRVINQLINKTMRRHNIGHIMAANHTDDPETRQRHIDALWAEDDCIIIRIK